MGSNFDMRGRQVRATWGQRAKVLKGRSFETEDRNFKRKAVLFLISGPKVKMSVRKQHGLGER